jgi:hypothetical protein
MNDGDLNWIIFLIFLDTAHTLRHICYAFIRNEKMKDAFVGMRTFIENIRNFLCFGHGEVMLIVVGEDSSD